MIVPFTIGTSPADCVKFWMDIDPQNHCDASLMFYASQNRCPEPEVVRCMARVLRPGDFAVDAGANIGFFSLYMSRLVGPTGRVLAIEPGPNNLPKLRANLELNRVANIEVLAKALRIGDGPQVLYTGPDGGLNSMAAHEDAGEAHEVEAVWIGDVVVGVPQLLKIDIEGAERAALAGGKGGLYFRLCLPAFVIAEMNSKALARFGDSPESLRMLMSISGYDLFVLHPDGALPTLVPPNCEVRPERENTNVLFSTLDAVGEAWHEVVP